MRVIPKATKVKVMFFRNVSILDTLIVLVGLALEVLIAVASIGVIAKIAIMLIVLGIFITLFVPFDGERLYKASIKLLRYVFSIKHYSQDFDKANSNMRDFIAFKDVKDGYIVYEKYFAGVLQIDPREFRLLSEYRQDQIIDQYFARVIRSIGENSSASLIKIDRKLLFDKYLDQENAKKDELYKLYNAKELSERELLSRDKVIDDRLRTYNELNEATVIKKPFYYLVVYDENKENITNILEEAVDTFAEIGMTSHVLNTKELAVFLKYQFTDKFEEKDVDALAPEELFNWIIPHDVEFKTSSHLIDGREATSFTVKNFPLSVLNAWGYKIFNIPNTKVVFNLEPFEKKKAVNMLDRSIQELASQSDATFKASSLIDKSTHMETLIELLRLLGNDNETLFNCSLHFTVYADESKKKSKKKARQDAKKAIKRIITEEGFDVIDNFCDQQKFFISTMVSRYEPLTDVQRAIHSTSVAAVFPFVISSMMDDNGIILGIQNDYPIIVDFFKRNNERVNSNMVIMGKSGSGKSYATKTILSNLAAENSKIFILDPENEYQVLAANMGGRLIDVGTASEGRINPFHIITNLDADESEGEAPTVNNYAVHLQFLEEFFRVVLDGISSEALEYLNNLLVELYESKHISPRTDLSKLKAEDYPIFTDLCNLADKKLKEAKIDYDIVQLRILHNYISKFGGDGRNANLWNGPSTLSVKENFTVFNFQSLLANKNGVVANAQMLLVLKWLDNEIIKNREFNIKHNSNRKIIVVIDEAHVFIDPKHPVALDFMYQLAKRIRKYNGMQVVITQNIKDFVGSPDILRKSSAIINACQYSFIFALAPNDMDDLCQLYDKAGQINEVEQDQIVNNPRGNAFIITSPTSRSCMEIIASSNTRELFGEGDKK